MIKRKSVLVAMAMVMVMTLGFSINSYAGELQFVFSSSSEIASHQSDPTDAVTVYDTAAEEQYATSAWDLKKSDAISLTEWNLTGGTCCRIWLEIIPPKSDGTYNVEELDYGITEGWDRENPNWQGSRIALAVSPYHSNSYFINNMDKDMHTDASNAEIVKTPIGLGTSFNLYDIVSKNEDKLGGYKLEDCLYLPELCLDWDDGTQSICCVSLPIKFVDGDNSAATQTTWISDSKGWKVRTASGTELMNTWYQSPASGLWYYLGADGYMLTNTTTPDGYAVNSDGVWIQ